MAEFEDKKTIENDSSEIIKQASSKKKLVVSSISVFLVVAIVLTLVIINKKSKASTPSNAVELSKEQLEEICDELDYSVLAATAEHYCNSINSAYLYDADNDGRKELFLGTDNDLYYDKNHVLAFDTANNAIMSSAVHFGAAGSSDIVELDSGTIALEWGYHSIGSYSSTFDKWTNSGWEKYAFISGAEGDSRRPEFILWNAEIDGEAYTSASDFHSDLNDNDADELATSPYFLTTNYYATSSPDEVIELCKNHFEQYNQGDFDELIQDIDNDGENEYVFILKDYQKLWTENLQTVGSEGQLIEEFLEENDSLGSVVILADVGKEGVVFYTFFYEEDGYDYDYDYKVSWKDGDLIVKAISKNDIVVNNYFCSQIENINEWNNSGDKEEIDEDKYNKVCNNFISYLKKHYYTDVKVKYVDLCEPSGQEIICYCTNRNVEHIEIYAVYYGKMICLYNPQIKDIGAVYLVPDGNYSCLLNYSQSAYYSQNKPHYMYSYWLTRFNSYYGTVKNNEETIFVEDGTTPKKEDLSFFETLNKYLESATICYDIYELTGYSNIPNNQTDYIDYDSKYVSISNCNTSKRGTVKVNKDSWLNFREKPDINSEKILFNINDKESYVKQMNGSLVTVIDVINTNDTANPVWVKIKIKYSDREMTGYSSQSFIELTDIKTLSVNESFTVKADTNDTDLKWESSDNSVLSIDSVSGNCKANKSGLVIVTVTSASGSSDSCLIKVK